MIHLLVAWTALSVLHLSSVYARWVRDPVDYLLKERLQNGMPSWFQAFLFRVLLFSDKGLRAVYWPITSL